LAPRSNRDLRARSQVSTVLQSLDPSPVVTTALPRVLFVCLSLSPSSPPLLSTNSTNFSARWFVVQMSGVYLRILILS
ncbi:MAG: hypothetical protein ACXWQ5_16570, partial [Ktedonobacterales bacterium]